MKTDEDRDKDRDEDERILGDGMTVTSPVEWRNMFGPLAIVVSIIVPIVDESDS
jgi:hypothetical protein